MNAYFRAGWCVVLSGDHDPVFGGKPFIDDSHPIDFRTDFEVTVTHDLVLINDHRIGSHDVLSNGFGLDEQMRTFRDRDPNVDELARHEDAFAFFWFWVIENATYLERSCVGTELIVAEINHALMRVLILIDIQTEFHANLL